MIIDLVNILRSELILIGSDNSIKSKLVLLISLILMYLCWFYFVPNLYVILYILIYFLVGLDVLLVGLLEPQKRFVKAVQSGFVTCTGQRLLAKLPCIKKGGVFCPLCVTTFHDQASLQLVRNQSQNKLISSVDNSFPKQHTIHTHPFQFSRSPKLEKKKILERILIVIL